MEIDRPHRCPSYATGGQNTEFWVIKTELYIYMCSVVAQCFCVKITWRSRYVFTSPFYEHKYKPSLDIMYLVRLFLLSFVVWYVAMITVGVFSVRYALKQSSATAMVTRRVLCCKVSKKVTIKGKVVVTIRKHLSVYEKYSHRKRHLVQNRVHTYLYKKTF